MQARQQRDAHRAEQKTTLTLREPETTNDDTVVERLPAGLRETASTPSAAARPPTASSSGTGAARAKALPGSALFRRAALQAYELGESVTEPLLLDRVSTWTVLAFCLVMVSGALLVASFGHVELTSSGRAVLRAPEGLRAVAALTGGSIREVRVRIGQSLRKGEVIASIDTSELEAAMLEAERELAAARRQKELEEADGARLFAEAVRLLERQAKVTQRRMRHQRRENSRLRAAERSLSELSDRGLVARAERDQASSSVTSGEQERLSLEDKLLTTRAEVTALRRDRADRLARLDQELQAAQARLDGVKLLRSQTELVAPADGVVETLLVSAGDRVEGGTVVARLGPPAAPTSVIAFLPERDRAFLREGLVARLEVDRLPVGEFGSIPARVVRVAEEVALGEEVTRLLGNAEQAQPLVRVDLTIVSAPQTVRLAAYLRSGTLMAAHVPLRERRIIGLLFEPLHRWLDS